MPTNARRARKTKSKPRSRSKAKPASSTKEVPRPRQKKPFVKAELQRNQRRSIDWDHVFYLVRPMLVLVLVGFVAQLTLYVEMKPTRGVEDIASLSGTSPKSFEVDKSGIVDSGFVATSGLHSLLKDSQLAVDVGALLNSLLVIGCQVYCTYVGLWEGEFGLAFRITFAAWLRAFCGWFTYLPASEEYLQSNYDFPDLLFFLDQYSLCS